MHSLATEHQDAQNIGRVLVIAFVGKIPDIPATGVWKSKGPFAINELIKTVITPERRRMLNPIIGKLLVDKSLLPLKQAATHSYVAQGMC